MESELPASTPVSGPLPRLCLACSVHPQGTGNFCLWLRVPAAASELGTPWGGISHREHVRGSVGDPVGRRGPWAGSRAASVFSAPGRVAQGVRRNGPQDLTGLTCPACKAGPLPSPLPFPRKCRCEARQADSPWLPSCA